MNVLVPLDGSEASFRALAGALDLLGSSSVHYTLMNVVSEGMDKAPEDMVEEFDVDEDDEIFPNEDAANRMLAKAEAMCQERDAPSRRLVVQGRLGDSILQACNDHDVLVMHQLERSQLKETMRGSKTERLARRAGIHVLLVKTD